MILPNRADQFEEFLRLIKSSNQNLFEEYGRKRVFEDGEKKWFCLHLAAAAAIKTSYKSDQRYGNAFRSLPILPRVCNKCKKGKTLCTVGKVSESLLLIAEVAEHNTWLFGRNCALKLPQNHQISFAGIHHTLQNIQHIHHETHFCFSPFSCQLLRFTGKSGAL